MTSKKTLMFDFQSVKHFYKNLETDDISYIKSERNISAALTNVKN